MFIKVTASRGNAIRLRASSILWYVDEGDKRFVYINDGTTEPLHCQETMEELDSLIWLSSQPTEIKKAEIEI